MTSDSSLRNQFAATRPTLRWTVLAACALLPAFGAEACAGPDSRADDAGGAPADRIAAYVVDGSPGTASPDLRGEMVANYIVSIYSDDGAWVDLGRRAELRVPLRDASGHTLAAAMEGVPEGTYTRVRATLCHASVRLRAGSRVGGRSLERDTELHITETGDVIVERAVDPFRVGPGSDLRFAFDLESPRWITEEAVDTDTVAVPLLERAVTLRMGAPEKAPPAEGD